ncbi:hypothetical protein Q3G72_030362 [Acer saccharum]|nr:hypothetical protein Q3G72_030362 [Acer saccharum]
MENRTMAAIAKATFVKAAADKSFRDGYFFVQLHAAQDMVPPSGAHTASSNNPTVNVRKELDADRGASEPPVMDSTAVMVDVQERELERGATTKGSLLDQPATFIASQQQPQLILIVINPTSTTQDK